MVISLDNYPPKIILENITNNSEILPGEIINFTFEDKENNFDSAVYSKDSESNQSFSGKINTSEWGPGEHSVRVWANDTAGNYNSSYYEFTIKDIYNPDVKILNPSEGKEYNQTDFVLIKANFFCFLCNFTPLEIR